MKLFVFPILFLSFCDILLSDAYRILAIIPMNSRSHFVMFEQIVKNMAKQGHQVDVVSHYPQKEILPNYHDFISLAGTRTDFTNKLTIKFVEEELTGTFTVFVANDLGNDLCQYLKHPKLQGIIKNPQKVYDLVINQVFGAHCFLAFGHYLKVPVVGFTTSALYPWMNDPVGNPDNPAYIPNALHAFSAKMDFWERLQNTILTFSHKLAFNYFSSPQDAIIKEYFGPDAPGVRELERNIALLLVNSHHSLNGVRPFTPAVVEIGGIHVNDDGPELSPELKQWLDESTDGFVYFSFGSMFKIESLPRKVLTAIYASLAKLAPVRVLMKIAKKEELPPGLPENVHTLPWISQYKVLKHKNVRAFITHGGLMSTQESVVCGVPLIGIPLFADQAMNINVYVNKKMAVRLNYNDINENSLDDALNAVLKNPAYRKAAKKLSAEFLDRPMSAADTATFWIEYVIRNGPTALRSPVMDLTWWQAALLDVYGALLLAVILIGLLLRMIIRKSIAVILRTGTDKVPSDKKRR